jgi:hypothetical protein
VAQVGAVLFHGGGRVDGVRFHGDGSVGGHRFNGRMLVAVATTSIQSATPSLTSFESTPPYMKPI